MKVILAALAVYAVTLPAVAKEQEPEHVPEINASLALQFAALGGGLALLIHKRKKR